MKICVSQTRPIKGDIRSNIENHKELISLAVSGGADIIIFPELSLTGYEPELAKALATNQDDSRFDGFQKLSNRGKITIGIGIPTKNNADVSIGMALFQPNKGRQLYLKKYLHPDEEDFFVGGQNSKGLIVNRHKIALAICYELSVPEHAANAFKSGAEIYVASAVKSVTGIDKALARLSEIGNKYSMTVLLSNCIGQSGGYDCAGKTSIWNSKGLLVGQLNDTSEGILIVDTDTAEILKKTL